MLLISYGCSNDDTKNADASSSSNRQMAEPRGLITPERAAELDANWSSTRVHALENALGKEDNRSVKFSLEQMRAYLDYAENQARDLGYTMDGVRIYFAAYGDDETNGNAGEATVFMVPTGNINKAEANMFSFLLPPGNGGDIPGGNGMNGGDPGDPPSSNYPQ